jgi:hypothetical protein
MIGLAVRKEKKSNPGDMHKILFVRIGIDLFLKKIRSVEILFLYIFVYSLQQPGE